MSDTFCVLSILFRYSTPESNKEYNCVLEFLYTGIFNKVSL